MNSRLNKSSEKENPQVTGGPPLESTTGEFPSGAIRGSPRAIELQNKIDFDFYLRRHLRGDDGDVSEDQHQRNRLAQRDGLRIWSIYKTPENPDGEIWIITEADRSVTHIMFPSEHDAPDPYDATKCHKCGQHKETMRSRRVITVGDKSGTVRWKFCDECAATLMKSFQPKDEEDNQRQRL